MSRLNFTSVSVRNFFSYGNVPTVISLDDSNFTVIRGKNGSGKSCIITDSLCFALYNKPYKKVNKSAIVNSINRKNCVVEVEFFIGNKNYRVVRGTKPNLFEIYCDSELINPPTDSRDYQKILEEQILRMTYKTFTQVVILGAAGFVPFMELTPAIRREVVDDLLDAEVYTTMNELLKERLKKTKEELSSVKRDIDEHESKISMLQKVLEKIRQDNTDVIDGIKTEISTNQIQIDSLTNQSVELKDRISKLDSKLSLFGDVSEKLTKYKTYYNQITTKQKSLYTQKQWYSNTEDCPTCKQKIFEETKVVVVEGIDKSLGEIESGITDLGEKITVLSEATTKKNELLQKIVNLQNEQNEIKSKVLSLTNVNTRLEKQISDLSTVKDNEEDLVYQIRTLTDSLKQKETDKEKVESEYKVQNLAGSLLKDGGIKANIIKQYIPVFNHLINKYLEALDLFVSFELDENFQETVKSRHRDEFTYDNFSQGQKARINLAILFAWRQVAALKNSASTNILILDEVFDSSMDYDGNLNLQELLTQEMKEVKLFVVTHTSDDSFNEFFDRRLDIKLLNGYSDVTVSK